MESDELQVPFGKEQIAAKPWLDNVLCFIFPVMLIPRRSWVAIWLQKDEHITKKNIQVYLSVISILFFISAVPIFFVNSQLLPVSFWIVAKVGTGAISLLSLLIVNRIPAEKVIYQRLLLILASSYCVFYQGLAMVYRTQTPFFYIPVFSALAAITFRGNMLVSVSIFLYLVTLGFVGLGSDTSNLLHMASMTSVLLAALIYIRSKTNEEIQIFIIEQRSLEYHRKLIETQTLLNEQIGSFLPREIFKRVRAEIQRGVNPLAAVDSQLRPRTVYGTVLHTDIRGFTTLTKKGDAALLKAVVPAQQRCTNIVEDYAGIPRLQGDLVYAYYDNDNPMTNVINAILTAIRIDLDTKALNLTIAEDTQILRYVIIAFGRLLVGNLGGTKGGKDISVLGDAANLPSRLDAITKLPFIAEQLKTHPIMLTAATFHKIAEVSPMIDIYRKVSLLEQNIRLRDFEEETEIFLLEANEKTFQFFEAISQSSIEDAWSGSQQRSA